MSSPWHASAELVKREALMGSVKTDVLVIGGGIAGILCAYQLKCAGVDCILVEADRACMGVTGSTTAKITSQHGLIYADLIRRFGVERAQMYLEAQERALARYRTLSQEIDFSFQACNAYVYATGDTKALEREMYALERIGYPAKWATRAKIPMSVNGAICFSDQAQMHPLKLLSALSKDLRIYENTAVRGIENGEAVCDGGRIVAKHIIVATHFPFLNKHGAYFLKLYQSRSYVCGFEGASAVDGMYIDAEPKGLSFRNAEGLLLIGSGAHRTGKKSNAWGDAEAFAREYYPKARLKCRWAAQDCMTLDGLPYIGVYSKSTPNLYVATGFGKWGMTNAMVAAELLCDMITGCKNDYEALFSPARSVLRPQLAVNVAESLGNLLYPFGRRCPHMGCTLNWNAAEHSWDCPCHGSRFDAGGHLLDNPATRDLS